MAMYQSISTTLSHLKRDNPFHPFDIVTRDGNRVFVGGRWMYAFSENYVLVRDEKDYPTRVKFKDIASIEPKLAEAH